jgi:hypothetical protein
MPVREALLMLSINSELKSIAHRCGERGKSVAPAAKERLYLFWVVLR